METLKDEINQNPAHNWTLAEMASRMNISVRLLQKKYKKLFGISCMEDVIQTRISYAIHLLQNTEYTVQNISSLCGYKSTEHFCWQFKQRTGSSPLCFRNAKSASFTPDTPNK